MNPHICGQRDILKISLSPFMATVQGSVSMAIQDMIRLFKRSHDDACGHSLSGGLSNLALTVSKRRA